MHRRCVYDRAEALRTFSNIMGREATEMSDQRRRQDDFLKERIREERDRANPREDGNTQIREDKGGRRQPDEVDQARPDKGTTTGHD
jgi:hypothetical protein